MRRKGIIALALLGAAVPLATPASAQVSIGITVNLAPPPLPVYAQPPLPGPDYIWTPGYWAWDDYAQAYFWVPGAWVLAPQPGLLWTPPWWGWDGGVFLFHTGYWGHHVGFYGGVPYGFGYTGFGFQGGYWNGGHVFYNRAVTNVTNVTNVNVTNVYQRNVTVNNVTKVSYNGGPGGVQARPTPQEQAASQEARIPATGGQQAHVAAAKADPQAFASANHGRPPKLVAARPIGLRPNAGPAPAAGAPRAGGQPIPGSRGAMPPPTAAGGSRTGKPPRQIDDAARPPVGAQADVDRPAPRVPPANDELTRAAPPHAAAPPPEAFGGGAPPRAVQPPPHAAPPHAPPPPRPAKPAPRPKPAPHPKALPPSARRDEH